MYNVSATLNIVSTALKAAGINLPAAAARNPFPQPDATPRELVDALTTSTAEDPYSDPKVQTVVAKLIVKNMGNIDHVASEDTDRERLDYILENFDAIHGELHAKFAQHAAILAETASIVSDLDDPSNIDLRNSNERRVTAATEATKAVLELERIVQANRRIDYARGKSDYGNSRGTSFLFHNAAPEQWEVIRGNPTVWEAARHGIPLTLAATDREVAKRYRDMLSRPERDAQARRTKSDDVIGRNLVKYLEAGRAL